MADAVKATLPRWIPLLSGMVGTTTVGMLLYVWSVFIKPFNAEFGWTRAEISLAFSIYCLAMGLASLPVGRWNDRVGPRIVVCTGGILMGVGFILSGFITSKYQLYLTYGVMGGLGGALVYLPPLATAPKWWPDRKALATGCSVVGMGLGSFIMGPLASWIISVSGWREVFWYCGAAMGLLAVLASLPLTVPPPGWKPPGWTRPPCPSGVFKATRDYTHAETIRTPQFRLLYLSYFCGSCAGLMVISQIAGHGRDAGLSAMAAGWAVSCLAFTNAATRILTGIFVDRIGVKTIFIVWFSLQIIALLLLFPVGGTWWALCLVAALIGWNYGGMFTLFPSSCLVYFGPTAQGANYGLMSSAWGLAGLVGPFVGGYLKDATGSYLAPFIGGAAVMAISVIMSTRLRPPPQASLELPKATRASSSRQLSPAGRLD